MTTPVLLPERVKTSIALGESHFREFKSAYEGPAAEKKLRPKKEIAEDICRTLVGFANADGGELLVGVEDDGRITGIGDMPTGTITYLEQCWRDGVHKDTPLEGVRISRVSVDDQVVLHFLSSKSTKNIHLTSDGRCLQRRDLDTLPVHFEEIQFSRQEQASQVYDREYVSGASVDDLDIEAVRVLAQHVSVGMTPEKCLQYLGMADFSPSGLQLTRAALLLFAKDIWKWHPRSHARILRVEGTEVETGASYNVVSDNPIQGNILYLIEETWRALRPYLAQAKLSQSGIFEGSIIYPEAACREALINAVGHRDYSQEGRGIEIYIFDNRIEVKNPGALLSSLTVEDLLKRTGAHQSRNTLIARCLRELGYMREVGEGIRRMFQLMSDSELEPPSIQSDSATFSVTLSNSLMYSRDHLLWLSNFDRFDLTKNEKTVIVLGYNDKHITPNDIINGVGIVDIEDYRKLVDGLQKKGILTAALTRSAAYRYAEKNRVSRRDVPRFKISISDHVPVREQATSGSGRTRYHGRRGDAPERKPLTKESAGFRVFVGNVSRNANKEVVEGAICSLNDEVIIEWPESFSSIGPLYCVVHVRAKRQADFLARNIALKEYDGSRLIARVAKSSSP